ncbi:hypothetical protein KM043_016954 [Ampulex compressa]|nr:hypothetical protein KM043_016954 [Ampulex compressa]
MAGPGVGAARVTDNGTSTSIPRHGFASCDEGPRHNSPGTDTGRDEEGGGFGRRLLELSRGDVEENR